MMRSSPIRWTILSLSLGAAACSPGDDTAYPYGAEPSAACAAVSPPSSGTQYCSSSGQGRLTGGFQWSIWSSGSGGCITPYNADCAFKATWKESGDFLARAGFQWNSTQTHDVLGTVTADYTFTRSGTGGSFSYIGVYGWSKNPLVEYYIVEDWFSKPNAGSNVGTITIDGDAYTVYKNTRVDQPSIEGTATFDQFFSIRQVPRQCGHIAVSQHFAEWDRLGLRLGNMYEAKLLAEAGGGEGMVDFTSATMTLTK
jgi:endo-1,4-beta-xylanase